MKMSLYLHKRIVDVLRCYGDLEDVINRLLSEVDPMDYPKCEPRNGAGRYVVNIIEPNYLELLSMYGPFSSKISIRRLLYWFVDNEIYDELGWEPCNEYVDKSKEMFNTKLANAISELQKAKRYTDQNNIEQLTNICNMISSCMR